MGIERYYIWCLLLSSSLVQHILSVPEQNSNLLSVELAKSDGFMSGEPSLTASSSDRSSSASGRRRDPVTGDEYGPMYGESPDGRPGMAGGLTGIGGTLWCGVGNLAADAAQLGASAAPDACCRQHDHCTYTIPAFARRYGLLNLGAETMSHCTCDAEFRRCLRAARSAVALDIGRIFFNLRKKTCFRFDFEECWERRGRGDVECFRLRRHPTARRRLNPHF